MVLSHKNALINGCGKKNLDILRGHEKNQRIRKKEKSGKPRKEKEQEKERGQQIPCIQFLVPETSLSFITNCPSSFCFNTLVSIFLVEWTKQDLFSTELLELPLSLSFLTTVPVNNSGIRTSKTSLDHFRSLSFSFTSPFQPVVAPSSVWLCRLYPGFTQLPCAWKV